MSGPLRSSRLEPGAQVTEQTVEQLVRHQMSVALGGRRGMVEGIVPTLAFTLSWILSSNLQLSLAIGGGAALVALLLRLVQRSSVQYVLNAIFGITIAAIFALRSGDAEDAFLPGILYNAGYFALLAMSALLRWPVVGFMIGSVAGDPTGWHDNPQIVRLCALLTWILAVPCAIRVAVQYPLWAAGEAALLGFAKIALGWPLQVGALAVMAWVLARNHTPLEPVED
ncbi:MAG TPA: DUF3159 domain-containing protein [Nocardioidaceae bacterium]|nr:DUF3159 domain-containing protein [Nocardioidaceae bacterium]